MKLQFEKSILLAVADHMMYGEMPIVPLPNPAKYSHRCSACGFDVNVGDEIAVGIRAGREWYVHCVCPNVDLFQMSRWLTEWKNGDVIAGVYDKHHNGNCGRCRQPIHGEAYFVREPGPLSGEREFRRDHVYVCKECVRR